MKTKPIKTAKNIFIWLIILIFSAVFFTNSGFSNTSPEEKQTSDNHMFFNISVLYPLSVNKNDDVSTNINLSLFYGRVGSVSGIELSSMVNHVKRNIIGFEAAGLINFVGGSVEGCQSAGVINSVQTDFTGLQTAGVANSVIGTFTGCQTAGVVNYVNKDFTGLQAAGIANYANEDFIGFQTAGVANYVNQDFTGLQTAGVANTVIGSFTGCQAAGVANYTDNDFTGLQAAGISNIVIGNFTGCQTAVFNLAGNVSGVQVSVINIAKEVSGVQIGLVNIANKINGVPIGLVNVVKEGKIHAIIWGSNIIQNNIGIKFAVNDYFYSTLCLGYNNLLQNINKSLTFGFTMGLHFPVHRKVFFDFDLGSYNVDNETLFKETKGYQDQYMLQGRLMIGYKLFEKLSIIAGIGQNYSFEHDQNINKGIYKTLFLAGLELF
jgi:hypothetical protein